MSNTGAAAGRRRLLGEVASKVQTGHIVVKLSKEWIEKLPRMGWRVEYENNGVVGIVVDIIGNVVEPFAVVKLEDRSMLEKIEEGSKVYIVVPKPKPRRRSARPSKRGGKSRARERSGRRGAKRGAPRRPGRGVHGGGRRRPGRRG